MTDTELRPMEKREADRSRSEGMTGAPYFSPQVDICETQEALTLVADMPGVDNQGVEIDLNENVLTVQGHTNPSRMDGFDSVYQEYRDGHYYRQFILSEVVDREKITAEISGGVLRVTLPKVSRARPRKIEVKSA